MGREEALRPCTSTTRSRSRAVQGMALLSALATWRLTRLEGARVHTYKVFGIDILPPRSPLSIVDYPILTYATMSAALLCLGASELELRW
eukprot:2147198-Pleurochrysis_carterae.AAC.2